MKIPRILAIIPARGGSKGLPGKNIRPLCGKPLIGWTIEQAQASKYISDIYISTDSREIAEVARGFGVPVPELRPAELATDTAPSSAFVLHTIERLRGAGREFDYIILLEPTSPLRKAEDIDRALRVLMTHPTATSMVGVSKVEACHPAFLVHIGADQLLHPYLEQMQVKRRQELDALYYFEGTIYISRTDAYEQNKSFYHDRTLPYVVPKWQAFEVDDAEDWFIIESILKNRMSEK